MVVGTAGFVTNDMFVKLASESLPTSQIIFVRGTLTTILMLCIALVTNSLPRITEALRPAVGWRAIGEVSATVLYLIALFHMPIANASAIIQAVPIAITLVASLFLGEAVGWRRWLAIVAGFAGILMIVKPGSEGFSAYGLLAVAALAFVVLRDISTRHIPFSVPAILVALLTSCLVTLTGAIWSAADHWEPLTAQHIMLLAAAALTLTAGYHFLVDGVRYGEISAVAPLRYTYLLWALLYGFLIWNEIPDLAALGGIALIVGSGLFVYRRQARPLRNLARVHDDNPHR